MSQGITQKIRTFAKQLRRDDTPAERRLWKQLRDYRLQSIHFRRQQPMGSFIFDFACLQQRLLIELDGYSHNLEGQNKIDETKERFATTAGYKILRFSNQDIFANMDGVLRQIESMLDFTKGESGE